MNYKIIVSSCTIYLKIKQIGIIIYDNISHDILQLYLLAMLK